MVARSQGEAEISTTSTAAVRRPAPRLRPSAGGYLAATAALAVGCTLTLLPGVRALLPGARLLSGGALPDAPARAAVLTLLAFGCEWAGLRADHRHGGCQNESADFRAVGAPYFPVLLAAVLMLPPAAAGLVPLPGLLLAARYAARRPAGNGPAPESGSGARSVLRPLWNAAQLALAANCAGLVFRLLDGPRLLQAALPAGGAAGRSLPALLLPAWPATLAYVLTGGALVAGARMLVEGVDRLAATRGLLRRSLLPALAHGLVGLLMAVLWQGPYGAFAGALVLLPLTVSAWVLRMSAREQAAHAATVRALVQAVEIKDSYTRGHSERVGRAAVLMAGQLGMAEERIASLRVAGTLHDIGKLGVPTRVLRKNGPLSTAERRAIELHPEYGHEMVRGIAFLGEARAGILHHHERWDGRGYPFGLAGDTIPEFARVIAVADAFDSMTSTRSYRRGRPVREAVAELRRCAGTQFDPVMVGALVSAVGRHGWQVEPGPSGREAAAVPDVPLGLPADRGQARNQDQGLGDGPRRGLEPGGGPDERAEEPVAGRNRRECGRERERDQEGDQQREREREQARGHEHMPQWQQARAVGSRALVEAVRAARAPVRSRAGTGRLRARRRPE